MEDNRWDVWQQHGILGVEMESQILFTLAKRLGAKALAILTVSDNILTGASASKWTGSNHTQICSVLHWRLR
ncbi:MAG: hypothetical protein R2795_12160 [Saprospiraceae bacterium]